jgi:nucleotide-binding universal stress UspA family protein
MEGMPIYRRILVPVDGSTVSAMGLRHAVGLARSQRARLRILNVLDDTLLVPALGGYSEADVKKILSGMGTVGRDAIGEAAALAAKSGVRAETAVVKSRGRLVSDVIVAGARKWRADLIVMGTHGRRGFNRLLMGSDAERVLAEAPVPVLLVRRERGRSRS